MKKYLSTVWEILGQSGFRIVRLVLWIATGSILIWAVELLNYIAIPVQRPATWVIITVSALVVISCHLLAYAVKKRDETTPRFDLVFDAADGGIEPAVMIHSQGRVQTDCRYIRPAVRVTSLTSVKGCKAYLNRVEKYPDQGAPQNVPFNGYPLKWAHHLGQPEIDIGHGIPQHIDLALTMKPISFGLCAGGPILHRNLLDDPGIYVFHVAVAAETLSRHIKVRVKWTGQWDQITAEAIA